MQPGEGGKLIIEGNLERDVFCRALVQSGAINTYHRIGSMLEPHPINNRDFRIRYPIERNLKEPVYEIEEPQLVAAALQVAKAWSLGTGFSWSAVFSPRRFLNQRIEAYELKLMPPCE